MTDRSTEHTARSSYLLDGRRATISDLIDNELILPGEIIVFRRPRIGKTYIAKITEKGRIELEDGQEYTSPSRAATAVAEMRAVDGWRAWVVQSTRRSLDSLRKDLLDKSATQTLTIGNTQDSELRRKRYDFLDSARSRAESGDPVEVSVRGLLAHWNAEEYNYRASAENVHVDLANHGITTYPDFRKVTLDTTVHLISTSVEREDFDTVDIGEVENGESEEFDAGLTVGNLPSALGGVASVTPNATLDEAITIMLLNNYSQLAVLSGQRNLRGTVTWQSIAEARHDKPDTKLNDTIIENPPEVPYSKHLIDVLDLLRTEDFVFVRNAERAISGIVTTADVAHVYGDLATPFFLVGELDRSLRHIISLKFNFPLIKDFCDPTGARALESVNDLTMGDYQQVLAHPEKWNQLGLPLDRVTFIKRLNELREIRNNIMHFNPDSVPLGAVDKLRHVIKILRRYAI